MSDGFVYIITLTLLVALGGLAFWILKQSAGGGAIKLFQNKAKRTGVVEVSSVDSRRRLILVRRDNLEHLIMTGGPVDVVIETGIRARPGMSSPIDPLDMPIGASQNGHSSVRSVYSEADEEHDPVTIQHKPSN